MKIVVDSNNEGLISQTNWEKADELTKETDSKDIAFVALTLHIPDSFLWTNDTKLIKGLKQKGFNRALTTHELIYKLEN